MPRDEILVPSVKSYKQLTFSLLQVFREVARTGSQAAAARELSLAQPTIWVQMQALELLVGVKSIEVRGRSSQLTQDGQRFLELSLPILEGFETPTTCLAESRGAVRRHLRLAATPRGMQEDLPACIVEFETRFPDVRLTVAEYDDTDISLKVANHDVDLGLTPADIDIDQTRYLHSELAYETEPSSRQAKNSRSRRYRRVSCRQRTGNVLRPPNAFFGSQDPLFK